MEESAPLLRRIGFSAFIPNLTFFSICDSIPTKDNKLSTMLNMYDKSNPSLSNKLSNINRIYIQNMFVGIIVSLHM